MPANRERPEQKLERLAESVEELQQYLPALKRLVADHEFRDLLSSRRRRFRNKIAFTLGCLAACATIGIAVASAISFLLRMF